MSVMHIDISTESSYLDSTTGDKDSEVWREHLHERAEEVDETAQPDTLLSANDIAESSGNESSNRRSDLETRDRDTGDARIDSVKRAISASVVPVELGDEDWVDEQTRHDA